MKLHTLKPARGATRRQKRLGCGPGSGLGKTCGRGHGGQRSRGCTGLKPWFEGGQLPLARRLPKKGFNHSNRHPFELVNVADLAQLAEQSEVTPGVLCEMGLIEGRKGARLKVLGKGEIGVALTVRAHAFSDAARRKILDAGGNVEEMPC